MKAIVVIDSVSRAAGGLLDAEKCLHQGLGRLGFETCVFALEDMHTVAELPSWAPLVPKTFPCVGPAALGWSADLHRAILAEPADLIYRAGLWRLPSKYAHEWSIKYRRPEIIAPHGMLDPWAVQNSRWKKRLAHIWFEGSHLREASCIRALCESEAKAIRAYGLNNPVCVIPNGIDLPEVREQRPETRGKKKELLFLGRLHPKKGLLNALKAWAKVTSQKPAGKGQEEWQFVIAGWDQGGHEAELKRLCKYLGLSWVDVPAAEYVGDSLAQQTQLATLGKSATVIDTPLQPTTDNGPSVIFTGPAFGETKDQLLRRASAFILPSFSEGLPMSVLEAWSYRLPVLMTDHCNLPEGFAAGAAICIGTDVESIGEGLHRLLQSTIPDLLSVGQNGRSLVERQFTWPMVATQMREVYDWVLGGGDKPGCVEG